jgi:hypothetical protein
MTRAFPANETSLQAFREKSLVATGGHAAVAARTTCLH